MLKRTRVAGQIACPSNALDPIQGTRPQPGRIRQMPTKPASEGMIEALEHFFLQKG